MIAIPLPLIIEGHYKQISLLEPLEHLLAVCLLDDRVTERGTELFEDRCIQQKLLHLLRLSSQDLLGQIVQDVVLISANLLQQGKRISSLGQGKTQELQAH